MVDCVDAVDEVEPCVDEGNQLVVAVVDVVDLKIGKIFAEEINPPKFANWFASLQKHASSLLFANESSQDSELQSAGDLGLKSIIFQKKLLTLIVRWLIVSAFFSDDYFSMKKRGQVI